MISHVMVNKQTRAHFKYCQAITNVQIAWELHNLDMDFCPFDNDFKQLCTLLSFKELMQQCRLSYWTEFYCDFPYFL